jgi:hypothetical protein
LGWRYARGAKQGSCENCECEGANFGHDLSVIRFACGLPLRCGFDFRLGLDLRRIRLALEGGRGAVCRSLFEPGARMKPGLTERIIARWGNEKLCCFELETVVSG